MQTKLNFDSQVYQQLSQKLSVLDTFKGIWKAKENLQGQYLKELRKIATIESAGSSTRIEGAKLTDQEVAKLLAKGLFENLIFQIGTPCRGIRW